MSTPLQPADSRACLHFRNELMLQERGPHPLPQGASDLATHLAACATCRAYADEMATWRRVGQRLRTTETAPSAVRQRVFRGLALARAREVHEPAPRRSVRATAIVAVAICASALLGLGLWRHVPRSGAADSASILVEDHWRDIHHQFIDSADPALVQRWLSDRLTIPVQVEKMPGATLEGARLCFLRGRLGAVLRYRVDGSALAYYVMPANPHAAETEADDSAIRQESAQGFNVLSWRDRGLLHALVSDLSRARLRLLAASCKGRNA